MLTQPHPMAVLVPGVRTLDLILTAGKHHGSQAKIHSCGVILRLFRYRHSHEVLIGPYRRCRSPSLGSPFVLSDLLNSQGRKQEYSCPAGFGIHPSDPWIGLSAATMLSMLDR